MDGYFSKLSKLTYRDYPSYPFSEIINKYPISDKYERSCYPAVKETNRIYSRKLKK